MARQDNYVPDIVIGRLPIYLRALNLLAEEGKEITSSQELSKLLGISPAQIRKDLSHFGEFGKQGTGYEIYFLKDQIRKILHVDQDWPIALIGIGSLGHALANYNGWIDRGFHIAAVFDADVSKIGAQIGGLTIHHTDEMEEVIQQLGLRIAIIAVPSAKAQDVADTLVKAGIKAILNYAPISLTVPGNIHIQYIDPAAHLQRMTFYLS
jgi:redox-sensing transcriptional repressor